MCTFMIAHLCVDSHSVSSQMYSQCIISYVVSFSINVFLAIYSFHLLEQLSHSCYIPFFSLKISPCTTQNHFPSKSFSLKIFCVTLMKIHQLKGEKNWYFLTMIFLFNQMVPISSVFCMHTFCNTVLWILFLLLFYSG